MERNKKEREEREKGKGKKKNAYRGLHAWGVLDDDDDGYGG